MINCLVIEFSRMQIMATVKMRAVQYGTGLECIDLS